MIAVYTDLDGALLDAADYSWQAAQPALDLLRAHNIPLIFVTSKTAAETEALRDQFSNTAPYVVENGGAIYTPQSRIAYGTPRSVLNEALDLASTQSGCAVAPFSGMSVEEVMSRTGLNHGAAVRAMRREFDEPFVVLDGSRRLALLSAIESAGLFCTVGGKFHHIHGRHNKRDGVELLNRRLKPSLTIGLGDSMIDAGFLNAVDVPIIVRSAKTPALAAAVPQARITAEPGPTGWNQAMLEELKRLGFYAPAASVLKVS